VLPQSRRKLEVYANPGQALLEGFESPGNLSTVVQESEGDTAHGRVAVVSSAQSESTGGQPYGKESGLVKNAREVSIAELEPQILRLFRRRHELQVSAWLYQRENFRNVERPAIETYLVDLAREEIGVLDASDKQVGFWVVEVCRTHGADRDLVPVDIQPSAVVAATDDGCHVLPVTSPKDSRS